MATRTGTAVRMLMMLAVTCLSSVAAAQDASVAERAERLFAAGVRASSASRWLEAERLFERSVDLSPRPSTLLNLAVVRSHLGKEAAALQALDAFEQVAAQEALRLRAQWLRDSLRLKLEAHEAPATSPSAAPDAELEPLPWQAPVPAELTPLRWDETDRLELAPIPWT